MNKIIKSTPFLAILCCILWASTFVPTKIGLSYMPSPLQFAGYTYLTAGILLLPWAHFGYKYIKQVTKHWFLIVKIAFFSTALLYGAFYMGQNLIDGSLASLIVSAQPFFVSVLAHFMLKNEKFTPIKIFSVLLAVCGVVVVSFPSIQGVQVIGLGALAGILLMLLNCVSAAYANIVVSGVDYTVVDIRVLTSSQLILGGGMLLLLAGMFEDFETLPDEGEFYLAFGVMVLITIVTIVAWYMLLARKNVKVSELNMWKFLIPIFGTVESWTLLQNDTPNVYSVVGMVILTVSLLVFYHRPLCHFIQKKRTVNNDTK